MAELTGCSERTGRRIVRRAEAALEPAGITRPVSDDERPVAGHGDCPAAPVPAYQDALMAAAA